MPEDSYLTMWILNVKHDMTVQINSRITGTQERGFDPIQLGQFLQENLSLFQIMIEEDPEYQQLEMLQNGNL